MSFIRVSWLRNIFKKKEFDVEKFSKEADETLEKKLKIIYKTDWYKKAKKQVYEMYEEFKEEHKDLIGKIFEHNECGYFKITGVREPWFLKSPILVDDANFRWQFNEEFTINPFNFNGMFTEISLEEVEMFCTEVSQEQYKKDCENNLSKFDDSKDDGGREE